MQRLKLTTHLLYCLLSSEFPEKRDKVVNTKFPTPFFFAFFEKSHLCDRNSVLVTEMKKIAFT